jgi:hypothetical protein
MAWSMSKWGDMPSHTVFQSLQSFSNVSPAVNPEGRLPPLKLTPWPVLVNLTRVNDTRGGVPLSITFSQEDGTLFSFLKKGVSFVVNVGRMVQTFA